MLTLFRGVPLVVNRLPARLIDLFHLAKYQRISGCIIRIPYLMMAAAWLTYVVEWGNLCYVEHNWTSPDIRYWATILAPCHAAKSPLLKQRSSTRIWNLKVPDLQMSFDELTWIKGIGIVVLIIDIRVAYSVPRCWCTQDYMVIYKGSFWNNWSEPTLVAHTWYTLIIKRSRISAIDKSINISKYVDECMYQWNETSLAQLMLLPDLIMIYYQLFS